MGGRVSVVRVCAWVVWLWRGRGRRDESASWPKARGTGRHPPSAVRERGCRRVRRLLLLLLLQSAPENTALLLLLGSSEGPPSRRPRISSPEARCLPTARPPARPPARAPRSVAFNFLGRDFFNALSAKDQERFTEMLFKWLGGIVLGVPVYVLRWVGGCRMRARLAGRLPACLPACLLGWLDVNWLDVCVFAGLGRGGARDAGRVGAAGRGAVGRGGALWVALPVCGRPAQGSLHAGGCWPWPLPVAAVFGSPATLAQS